MMYKSELFTLIYNMLTIKAETKYGLQALLYLALRQKQYCSAAEIARNEAIPYQFLEKILLQLKEANFLKVKRGVNGGYILSVPAQKISLAEILKTLEGSLTSIACFQGEKKCRELVKNCPLKKTWQRVASSLDETLSSISLADLLINNE